MMTGSLRCLTGCLLLAAGMMMAPATTHARTVLGLLARDSQQQVVTELQAEWSSALGDEVVVRSFATEQTLLDWLVRFRELDAALIPQALPAAQPAGTMITLGSIRLTHARMTTEWALVARGETAEAQKAAIALAFQALLQEERGLLLIERMVNPDAPVPVVQPERAGISPLPPVEPVGAREPAPAAAVTQPASPGIFPPSEERVAATASPASTTVPPRRELPERAVEPIEAPAPPAAAQPTEPAPPEPRTRPIRTNAQSWIFPHVELQGKLGNERSLADADLFIPVLQDRISLLFLDLRFQLDDDEAKEGNFGLGFRRLFNDWIAGGYAFFDVRESQYDNTFRQVTIGAEALTENYDARFNLYLADEDKEVLADIPVEDRLAYQGNYLLYSRSAGLLAYEKSMSGADFELGGRLPGPVYPEVRGYLGGYYFDAAEVDAIAGPRARVAVRFPDLFGLAGSYFELGGEVTHDSERDTDYYLTAGLRIPLGGLFSTTSVSLTPLEKRMSERVQRDPDIVIGERRQTIPATAPQPLTAGGVPITIAHVNSSGSVGSGTVEAPLGALPVTVPADIVLLHADSVFPDGYVMADNQRLLGEYAGMNQHIATDQLGSLVLPRVTEGTAKPLIGDTVVAGSDTEIGGVAITSAGGPGISGVGRSGTISIHDVDISGTGGDGITLSSGGNLAVAISNTTLGGIANTGIRLNGTVGALTVTDLSNITITDAGAGGLLVDTATFDAGGGTQVAGGTTTIGSATSRVAGDGLALENVSGSLSFDRLDVYNDIVDPLVQTAGVLVDVRATLGSPFALATGGGTVDTTNGAAVTLLANDPADLGLAVTLNSITSTFSPDYGVWLDNVSGSFAVTGAASVADSTDDGIFISNSSAAVALSGLSVSGAGLAGVALSDNAGTVTINGGTIDTIADAGILVQRASAAVNINGIDITGSGAEGLALVDNPALVTMSGGSIDDTAYEGIYAINSKMAVSGVAIGEATGIGAAGIFIYADNGQSTSFSIAGSTIENTLGNGLTVEAINASTITSGAVTSSLFDNIGGDGINVWSHGDTLIDNLQIGSTSATTRPAGAGEGDVSISNTGGEGILLLAGDRDGVAAGDNGTLKASINGIDISGTGGDNNIDLLVYGNGTGAYTVSNSYLDAATAVYSSIEIVNSGSLPSDTPVLTALIQNNTLLNSPWEGLYAENNDNAGVLNLRVVGNNSAPAGPGDVDGMAFNNIIADAFNLYLSGNASIPVGLYDGYSLYNGGTSFNLGATAGNPSIGFSGLDDTGVISGVVAAEGNDGSTFVDVGGDLTIIDQAGIPAPQ